MILLFGFGILSNLIGGRRHKKMRRGMTRRQHKKQARYNYANRQKRTSKGRRNINGGIGC